MLIQVFYANECIQCKHTYDWLLAAGYPQDHPYVQKELWYWQSNYRAYLEAVGR